MLRENRTFQFAIGLTTIFIVIRWLLTGDLLMAAESLRPPAEGETKSVSFLSVVGPMLIEAVVIVGSSVIAWSIKLWDLVFGLIDKIHQARADPAATGPQAGPLSVVGQPQSDGRGVNQAMQLVTDLARAVASGDSAMEEKLRIAIRRPYLRIELSEAVTTANYEHAREILNQLEAMDGANADSTSGVRGYE